MNSVRVCDKALVIVRNAQHRISISGCLQTRPVTWSLFSHRVQGNVAAILCSVSNSSSSSISSSKSRSNVVAVVIAAIVVVVYFVADVLSLVARQNFSPNSSGSLSISCKAGQTHSIPYSLYINWLLG